jgi:hypothetical protein
MMVIDAWKKAADDPLGVAPARRRLVRQPLSKVLRKMMTFHIAADASGARETSLEVRQRLIVGPDDEGAHLLTGVRYA